MKALAVQVFQSAGLGGKGEGQLIGIQRLIIPVKALIQLAIFSVTQQRMSRMGELSTDLMGPAGDQLALHQRKAVPGNDRLVVGLT